MNSRLVKKEIGEELYSIFKKNDVILAGGALRSIYCQSIDLENEYYQENITNDIDIYFKNSKNIKDLKSDLESIGYYLDFETTNALTYRKEGYAPIQLVILESHILKPSELIKKFDFSICSAAYDFKSKKFYLNDFFEEDNRKRKLRFNPNTEYPLCSLIRVNKYSKKKYTISNIEYLKIALSINNLNINTYGELKHHLNGIDTFVLKPLTDNLIYDHKYDINTFLGKMDEYLEEVTMFNSEENTNSETNIF